MAERQDNQDEATGAQVDERVTVKPRDAIPKSWVDRYAPVFARPYLRLMRADRPIGFWLLMWPCWWSVALATDGVPDVQLLALFTIGAIVMRGAGCTYNDLVDRELDASVDRTANRPIPSGQVSVLAATLFMVWQALTGLAVLLSFNTFAIFLGVSSLAIVAAYPWMKRITYWPQLVLGFAFNWGALMGWAVINGSLSPAPVVLYVGAIFWTLGYDTIYAHQDKEDDALIGIKSSALALGEARTTPYLAVFYGLFTLALGMAGYLADIGTLFYIGLALIALHFVWQIRSVDLSDADSCLHVFKSNHRLGMLVFVVIVVGQMMNLEIEIN